MTRKAYPEQFFAPLMIRQQPLTWILRKIKRENDLLNVFDNLCSDMNLLLDELDAKTIPFEHDNGDLMKKERFC